MNPPPITFSPPLPCSTVIGDQLCGKDATVGMLYPMGGGQYVLQPFCRACVAGLERVYRAPVGDAPDEQGHMTLSNGEEIP